MRILFEIDKKDYKENGTVGKRPSARAIIIKDDKIALVYSKKFNYYKFPGGGIEAGESNIDALVREVKEEAGLNVIKDSVKEYGLAIRKQAGMKEDLFIQENYYYFCDVSNNISAQSLDAYEGEAAFVLRFVGINEAIKVNEAFHSENAFNEMMIRREEKVLKMLKEEGCFQA